MRPRRCRRRVHRPEGRLGSLDDPSRRRAVRGPVPADLRRAGRSLPGVVARRGVHDHGRRAPSRRTSTSRGWGSRSPARRSTTSSCSAGSCGRPASSPPTPCSAIGGRSTPSSCWASCSCANMALTRRDQDELAYLIAFTGGLAVPAHRDARLRRARDLDPAPHRRPIDDQLAVPPRRDRVHRHRPAGLDAAHAAGAPRARSRARGRASGEQLVAFGRAISRLLPMGGALRPLGGVQFGQVVQDPRHLDHGRRDRVHRDRPEGGGRAQVARDDLRQLPCHGLVADEDLLSDDPCRGRRAGARGNGRGCRTRTRPSRSR